MIRQFLIAATAFVWTTGAQAAVPIQEVTSPGGITAWLVEEPSIPFTALEIRFRGGGSLDPEGKRGAVHLMTALIEEGAGDMDARGFAAAAEALSARFTFRAFDDVLSVSAAFLTENRDASVDLLRLALTEPRFDQDAIDRVRAQVESSLRSDATDPDTIAQLTFDRLAFGDHPYGSAIEGTLESVAGLTQEDMFTAHSAVFARDRIYVGAVGDITAEELGPLLDDLFAGLPETGAAMPETAPYLLDGGMTVVEFNAPQSVAIFGHDGIARDDEDFFPAYVLNEILGGGGLNSVLMEEVREKRGLTYGVYSYLAPKDFGALYLGSVSSSNDRIAEAIEVIQGEWTDIAANGVETDELDAVKTYLTGAYPLRFDSNGRIAEIIVGMQVSGLPIDYAETRNDKINAVTPEDIQRVAARILKPEELHFVVVGQPEGLEEASN